MVIFTELSIYKYKFRYNKSSARDSKVCTVILVLEILGVGLCYTECGVNRV